MVSPPKPGFPRKPVTWGFVLCLARVCRESRRLGPRVRAETSLARFPGFLPRRPGTLARMGKAGQAH